MNKLSPEEKKKLLSKYHRNEDRNYHTENAMMLINIFGTSGEKKKAKELKKKIDKQGYVTNEQSTWFAF